MIWIAVDACGGDDPAAIIRGALAATRHGALGVLLVGPGAIVQQHVAAAGPVKPGRVRYRDAGTVVAMADSPSAALRQQPDASIRVAMDAVASGDAAAVFSAGHTGATVLAAHAALGLLPGAGRPALAATIPTRRGTALLLDVGATADCRPAHLQQFGVMGSVYARLALGHATPTVGLLSIGEEAGKGNDLTREAHRLLRQSSLPFTGNVEARDLYAGVADVVVTDGFTGNVALKVSEGMVETLEHVLRDELTRTMAAEDVALLAQRAIRHVHRRVDYSEYGGAPLLGVAGVTVVGHGRSSAKAVRNAVALSYRLAVDNVMTRVGQALAEASVGDQ